MDQITLQREVVELVVEVHPLHQLVLQVQLILVVEVEEEVILIIVVEPAVQA